MKPLLVILLIAGSLQAQTLAEVARKERERQSKSKATVVITAIRGTEQTKPADDKPTTTEPPKPTGEPSKPAGEQQATAAADPVQLWNNQANQLRAKIRALQDQEMALVLQQNQVTNAVYAPVTDPATQERSIAQLGQVQTQIANVRKDLADSMRALDSMLVQGPPKK